MRSKPFPAILAIAMALVAACGDAGPAPGTTTGDPGEGALGAADTTTAVSTSSAATTTSPATTTGVAEQSDGRGGGCDLLEDLDVAGLLGEAPGEWRDGAQCVVVAADDDSDGELVVGLAYEAQPAFYQGRRLDEVDDEPAGLGDEAFISGTSIHVLAGSMYIHLTVSRDSANETPPPDGDDLVAAMRTVLTNVGMDT